MYCTLTSQTVEPIPIGNGGKVKCPACGSIIHQEDVTPTEEAIPINRPKRKP
jgi:hypothetical protein